ncbi:ABC transporter ATP-binding protein [Corallococcus sp. CA041A]|uniref:ABC transporter ATP-binding protein n=1 Tax=Corallococcus sp. CA041A TaxID=2316727 RepID=UPI000EA03EB2|nr:ABC transporter ATP-binding protein [Corallococcus sp. CA041A]RKH25507.1 ABC transporter ATP-binding protein [Corallococcus sp. CA041A]
MAFLSLDALTLKFLGAAAPAVRDVSLALEPGDAVALMGTSGSGKTALLRLVAGLEQPTSGNITLAGRVVAGPDVFVPPEQRPLRRVLHDAELESGLTVRDVVLGVQPKGEGLAHARGMLALFQLEDLEARTCGTLSRGQRQRVLLARALASGTKLLVLDEPFAGMDAGLRANVLGEWRRVLKARGTAVLFATHDVGDALAFADRLVLLRGGTVEQQGAPESVYEAPRSAFAAYFLGGTNLLPGSAFGRAARTALGNLPLSTEARGEVMLSLRPEALRLVPDTDGVAVGGALRAEVLERAFRGAHVDFTVSCAGMALVVRAASSAPFREGSRARLEVAGRADVLEETSGAAR